MNPHEKIEDVISKEWEERAKAFEQVRQKLRSGWRHDDSILDQYFESCVENWKRYTGPRKPKTVTKLQAVYKQALYGDCNVPAPADCDTPEGVKWAAWNRLKGTSRSMAKRRFITLLSEIDPMLIDVMPDEKPPEGFPKDRFGHQICAKCNSKVGCARPIMDQHHSDLRQQLFSVDELHEVKNLREGIKNALQNQRCSCCHSYRKPQRKRC